MESNFHKTFDQCPNCGSTQRFLEQLGNEVKERGLTNPNWRMCMDIKQGVVADESKANAIPIGSSLPGYAYITDICMDCGTIYAIDIARLEFKRGIDTGKSPKIPFKPFFNNPQTS